MGYKSISKNIVYQLTGKKERKKKKEGKKKIITVHSHSHTRTDSGKYTKYITN